MMERLGHDAPPTWAWTENLITGAPLARCPLRTILLATPAQRDALERYVDEYYPAYQDGHLLVAGGIGDQPGPYVDAMRTVGQYEKISQAIWAKERTPAPPTNDQGWDA